VSGPGSRARLTWRWALLLAVVALWQARDVPGFDFVAMDDDINILFNPHLGPPSADTLQWMFTDPAYMRRYVPLGWLGFSVVYAFSGLSPAGYHVAGVGLHALNTVLVFLVMLAVVRRFGGAGRDDRWGEAGAVIGAAWWSLHPFRAETVGWASGLFYGLAAAFALGSVLAYLRSGDAHVGARGRVLWLLAAAGGYLASVLSYPVSLGLVAVFFLIDWVDERNVGARGRRLREKLLFVVPAGGVLGMTWWAGRQASGFWPQMPPWSEFGLLDRLRQAAEVWFYYGWKPWWPTNLTPVPDWLVELEARGWRSALAAAVVVGITIVLLGLWSRARIGKGAVALWLAHAALVAPMLGWMEKPFHPSDRYHYLAAVVVGVAVALIAARVKGAARAWVAGVGLGVALILAAAQRAQLALWADTDTLLRAVVSRATHPGVKASYVGRWVLFHAGRGNAVQSTAVAIEWKGITIPQDSPVPLAAAVHHQRAQDFGRRGRTLEAAEHFAAALALAPRWREAAYNAAVLEALRGEARAALRRYFQARSGTVGIEITAAAYARLLGLIGGAFLDSGELALARRCVALGLREAETAGERALTDALRAQENRLQGAGRDR
jgi:hypothetical protein